MNENPSGVVPPPEILSERVIADAMQWWRSGLGHELSLSHEALRARVEAAEAERELHKQIGRLAVADLRAAEARVEALTAALTDVLAAYDDYMETDVIDDLAVAIGVCRVLADGGTTDPDPFAEKIERYMERSRCPRCGSGTPARRYLVCTLADHLHVGRRCDHDGSPCWDRWHDRDDPVPPEVVAAAKAVWEAPRIVESVTIEEVQPE